MFLAASPPAVWRGIQTAHSGLPTNAFPEGILRRSPSDLGDGSDTGFWDRFQRYQLTGRTPMNETDISNLMTAGKIAQELALSGGQVKKAIADLKIKPAAKKGACSYYSRDVLAKIKAATK